MLAYLKEEIKAGGIIVVSLILLSAFTILVGGTQFFEKFDTYYVKLVNAAGLEPGSQVRLGGVRAGRVMSIEPPQKPGEPVTITIGLTKGTPLYDGTRAFITQVGFVGDAYLLLSIEKTAGEKIKIGSTIPSVESVDFKLFMIEAKEISKKLDKLLGDIDKLFSDKTVENVHKMIENAAVVLEELGGFVGDNKEEFSQLISKTGDTIKAIEETAEKVGKASDSVDEVVEDDLKELLAALTETTEDLQEVLQEIKNKPWSVIYKEGKKENE
ncbi:MAG TPA: MCE family protein [Nitrospirae bacterium]|nr:MCE family protein [Nitrospirota bacterium]HDK16616.1 MCE family protein [Nitrospirota bacterium]HDK82676.1 MCE family protein [Nitrospirota bacterium]